MPKITWHSNDGQSTCEDAATVKVLISSLFVNGAKRRKLADLGEPPQRGDAGQVILRFSKSEAVTDWCEISFENKVQGDLFEHQVLAVTGKRKLSPRAGGASNTTTNQASSAESLLIASSTAPSSTSSVQDSGSTKGTSGSKESNAQGHQTDTKDGAQTGSKRMLELLGVKATKNGSMPAGWEKRIRTAVANTQSQAPGRPRFVNPLPGLLDWQDVKGDALKLLVEVCAAWESADVAHDRHFREEVAALQSSKSSDDLLRKQMEEERRELDAKLRTADLNAAALQKTKQFQEKEMTFLRKRVAELERLDPGNLRAANEHLETEIASLRQRLRETWKDGGATEHLETEIASLRAANEHLRKRLRERTSGDLLSGTAASHLSPCATAKAIAVLEGGPLEHCSAQDRETLKKKLLLKWHPDKQPSGAHGELATKVMQELQNLKAWNA